MFVRGWFDSIVHDSRTMRRVRIWRAARVDPEHSASRRGQVIAIGANYSAGPKPLLTGHGRDCLIVSNAASFDGGWPADVEFHAHSNCVFLGTSRINSGGRLPNSLGPAMVRHCTFAANRAAWGGALDSRWRRGRRRIVSLRTTRPLRKAAGLRAWNWGGPRSNCLVAGNRAPSAGG